MTGDEGRATPPYARLLPIVTALERAGNRPVDGGFLNSPAGWYCRMAEPIDFGLVRRLVDLPASVELAEDGDTILDKATWSAVLGPGADGYG